MNKIVTHSGTVFDLVNPSQEMVVVDDIALSLSRQARFAGHTQEVYTVAQHCVVLSHLFFEHPLMALLHDAAEAYITDIPTPVKELIPEIHTIEARILRVVYAALGISDYAAGVFEDSLHTCDRWLGVAEGHLLMPDAAREAMFDGSEPRRVAQALTAQRGRLEPWHQYQAYCEFLQRFYELSTVQGQREAIVVEEVI